MSDRYGMIAVLDGERAKRDVLRRALPCGLFLIAALYLYWRAGMSPSFLDFGLEASVAQRIANGQAPYRDFFILVPPLHFLLSGGTMAILGTSLTSLHVFAAGTGAAVTVLVWAVVRDVTSSRTPAIVAWLLTVLFSHGMTGTVPSYSLTAALFAVATVFAALQAERHASSKWAVAAGLFLAFAGWSKQTVGIYMALALSASGVVCPALRRHFRLAALAALLVSAGFLLYLAQARALDDFIRDAVTFPITSFDSEADLPVPSLSQAGLGTYGLRAGLFFAAVGALLAVACIHGYLFVKQRLVPSAGEILVSFSAAAVFLIVTERYSFFNLRAAFPLLIATTVVAGDKLYQHANGYWRRITVVAICAVVGLLMGTGVHMTARHGDGLVARSFQDQKLLLHADDALRADFVLSLISDIPHDRSVLVLPASPLYYFLSDRPNPSPLDLVIPGNVTPTGRRQLLDEIMRADVVIVDESFSMEGRYLEDYEPQVVALIRDEFKPDRRHPSGLIMFVRVSP